MNYRSLFILNGLMKALNVSPLIVGTILLATLLSPGQSLTSKIQQDITPLQFLTSAKKIHETKYSSLGRIKTAVLSQTNIPANTVIIRDEMTQLSDNDHQP